MKLKQAFLFYFMGIAFLKIKLTFPLLLCSWLSRSSILAWKVSSILKLFCYSFQIQMITVSSPPWSAPAYVCDLLEEKTFPANSSRGFACFFRCPPAALPNRLSTLKNIFKNTKKKQPYLWVVFLLLLPFEHCSAVPFANAAIGSFLAPTHLNFQKFYFKN